MRIPKFWTKARDIATAQNGIKWPLEAWGWSSDGLEEAHRTAADRLKRAIERLRHGEVPGQYEYLDVPLREEILDTLSASDEEIAVVTRNRYGAAVLNTADVLFADIDIPPAQSKGLFDAIALLFSGEEASPAQERRPSNKPSEASVNGPRGTRGVRFVSTVPIPVSGFSSPTAGTIQRRKKRQLCWPNWIAIRSTCGSRGNKSASAPGFRPNRGGAAAQNRRTASPAKKNRPGRRMHAGSTTIAHAYQVIRFVRFSTRPSHLPPTHESSKWSRYTTRRRGWESISRWHSDIETGTGNRDSRPHGDGAHSRLDPGCLYPPCRGVFFRCALRHRDFPTRIDPSAPFC